MTSVTQLLEAANGGDRQAADELLPLVYDELRKLATARMAREGPGQTIGATALVHEAYLRLTGQNVPQEWQGRGHFFAAAAEAMRRILVDRARRRQAEKRGGNRDRIPLGDVAACETGPLELLSVHESLDRLATKSPRKAELVKLRYFLGCTVAEAAEILGIAPATAEEDWTYARAWLRRELKPEEN